jgi:hypothetical protein
LEVGAGGFDQIQVFFSFFFYFGKAVNGSGGVSSTGDTQALFMSLFVLGGTVDA